MKAVDAYIHVKNRRHAYGEIVGACRDLLNMEILSFVFAQAMLSVVGFPAHMTFAVDLLGPHPEDHVYLLIEK
jgi:hypothetical protein